MHRFRISDFGLRNQGTPSRARTIRNPQSKIRNAFTLIELLITITIFLILTGMTIAVVNVAFEGERLRSGAQRVHSFLGGARDRAVYAGAPRGVRFIVDPNLTEGTTIAATSMVYVQELEPESGAVTFPDIDDMTPDRRRMQIATTAVRDTIVDLAAAGLVANQPRIRLARGPSSTDLDWYRIDSFDGSFAANGIMTLETDFLGTATASDQIAFELQLLNGILPNSEPVALPEGIMVHINNDLTSDLPVNAYVELARFGHFDLVFSPNGSLTGSSASEGIVHLVVCDIADVPEGRVLNFFQSSTLPEFATNFDAVEGGMRVVSIFTRTGQVTTNDLDPNSGEPFEYVLTGEASNE